MQIIIVTIYQQLSESHRNKTQIETKQRLRSRIFYKGWVKTLVISSRFKNNAFSRFFAINLTFERC